MDPSETIDRVLTRQHGPRPDRIDAARARVAEAEADLAGAAQFAADCGTDPDDERDYWAAELRIAREDLADLEADRAGRLF